MAWLNRYRRLVIRYERRADIQEAFVHLGCALICLNILERRRFLGRLSPLSLGVRPLGRSENPGVPGSIPGRELGCSCSLDARTRTVTAERLFSTSQKWTVFRGSSFRAS